MTTTTSRGLLMDGSLLSKAWMLVKLSEVPITSNLGLSVWAASERNLPPWKRVNAQA